MVPNSPDLKALNETVSRISQSLGEICSIFEKVIEDMGSIAETFKMPKDETWIKLGIHGCTCPWNNQWGPPGILPPHHLNCPSMSLGEVPSDGS